MLLPFLGYEIGGPVLLALSLVLGSHLPVSAFAVGSLAQQAASNATVGRDRISINSGWRFSRFTTNPDKLSYDQSGSGVTALKAYLLPSANDFINDASKRHQRPSGNPGNNVTYAQANFDDAMWETVNLPHDWAIKGPFYTAANAPVRGGMGRLPVQGVGWYRRRLTKTPADKGKSIYLDVDGAMSYASVWLNGNLVGGWPYGYNSFRLDLSPYLNEGDDNLLAIRLDNPLDSSRWYPGGGIYRNVWLTKVERIHVAQWGTYIRTRDISFQSATLDLVVRVENKGNASQQIELVTGVYVYNSVTGEAEDKVAEFAREILRVPAGQTHSLNSSVTLQSPLLWGPPPSQKPHLYVAVTHVFVDQKEIDTYETRFGICSIQYDATRGLLVNGEHIRVQGVNQHHDLGALGAAFHVRAAERQLEMLQEMGCNAIRTSHNPAAPELLDLADRMGFLVMGEIFDCWEKQKTASDFHLIFSDWSEPDLRAMLRRDRNHPSIIAWSYGNEVGEQTENTTSIAQRLHDMMREEDPTRPTTASMNAAKPENPFSKVADVISLNYQGEGIRDTPAYSATSGSKTSPLYPSFHEKFPGKLIWSSESSAALSTRGTYIFPVTSEISAPVSDSSGGNSQLRQVSAYELYTADFGSSADKAFATQDRNSFVAGQFVWSGWDYLGEPTPYYDARSSYFGIIDLAGFKKDRFFLYQAYWRPDHPMAHILPHWTWPDRNKQITPVHVFTAANEAELFLNGVSQGRKKKDVYTWRFRWDNITYQPGELHVVTYKDGKEWANDTVATAEDASKLSLVADRTSLKADGHDLSFITAQILDGKGTAVPQASHSITFTVSGPGELVATDNGDPNDMTAFPSRVRKAFSGLALAIVRTHAGDTGKITVTASAEGLVGGSVNLDAQ